RLLAPADYGLYTIANSMLAALAVLGDSGIVSATIGIGGRNSHEQSRLGSVIRTAHQAVRLICNVVGAPVAAACIWILVRNGATVRETLVLTALVIVGGILALRASIDLAVPRLRGDTRFIQVNGSLSVMSRLVGTLLLASLGLTAETAILAVVLGWI